MDSVTCPVINRKHSIVDLILSRSTTTVNKHDLWEGSSKQRASFASDTFPHRALRGLTALHYACLLGDMEIMGVLLRHGAKWTKSDFIDLLPGHYIDVSNGDGKMVEFKRLCEEEISKEEKKRKEEDELRQAKEREAELKQAKKLAEEEESKRLKTLEEESKQLKKFAEEEELKRLTKLEEESKQLKKIAEEEESKQLKKLEDEEALLKRHTRQSKCFPSQLLTALM